MLYQFVLFECFDYLLWNSWISFWFLFFFFCRIRFLNNSLATYKLNTCGVNCVALLAIDLMRRTVNLFD